MPVWSAAKRSAAPIRLRRARAAFGAGGAHVNGSALTAVPPAPNGLPAWPLAALHIRARRGEKARRNVHVAAVPPHSDRFVTAWAGGGASLLHAGVGYAAWPA